jgi:outer membrane receptor for ferric coprogen and ferric-rhodotorulic acid
VGGARQGGTAPQFPPPPPPPRNDSEVSDPKADTRAAQAGAQETTLPTVTVSAEAERETLTEFTGSYTTGATNTTMKLPLTLRETPQSITVITRQQMDDFGLNTLNDVLQNTSSVYVDKRSFGVGYISRGFYLQNQYDGIANPTNQSLGTVQDSGNSPDSAFLDHIEIQQGAAGLLTGAGYPGGTINLVRKRPTESFQAQVEAELGSWDKKRLVGDISGPLTSSGVLRGRLVVVSDESDSFVDYVFDDKKAFYGILELVPNADTKIGLGLQYQKDRYRPFRGIPTATDGRDLGLSRSAFIGDPYHSAEEETLSSFLSFEQKLPNDWVLKANYAHNKLESDMPAGTPQGTLNVSTGDGLRINRYRDAGEGEADSVDVHASGPVQLFGRRHEIALGANGAKHKSCYARANAGPDVPINIYTHHPSEAVLKIGTKSALPEDG